MNRESLRLIRYVNAKPTRLERSDCVGFNLALDEALRLPRTNSKCIEDGCEVILEYDPAGDRVVVRGECAICPLQPVVANSV